VEKIQEFGFKYVMPDTALYGEESLAKDIALLARKGTGVICREADTAEKINWMKGTDVLCYIDGVEGVSVNEETIIRPEVGGSSASDLLKELDLVGYMEMSGKIRTISFDPCEKFYAKNSCDMQGVIQIPLLIDDNGNPVGENNFLVNVIKNYHNRLKKNKEQTAKYEAFVEEIKAKISGIANAEDANNFVQWVKEVEHIYNSKAVALTQLLKRAKELGLTYNKATEKYA
jgi:hypothetical protein